MKAKLIANMLIANAIALGSIASMSHSSYAQNNTYFCGTNRDGVPTTYARTATGKKIPVISWQKNWNSKFSAKERCEVVSARFQNASVDGVLNYRKYEWSKGFVRCQSIRRHLQPFATHT
jgi:hypothetical protein